MSINEKYTPIPYSFCGWNKKKEEKQQNSISFIFFFISAKILDFFFGKIGSQIGMWSSKII